jgi:hypothetical protein
VPGNDPLSARRDPAGSRHDLPAAGGFPAVTGNDLPVTRQDLAVPRHGPLRPRRDLPSARHDRAATGNDPLVSRHDSFSQSFFPKPV